MYPSNVACLWIVAMPNTKSISIKFDETFDISDADLCQDYLLTTYPGIKEPLVECGKTVTDKEIRADQAWIEFRSNSDKSGKGFSATYVAANEDYIPATLGIFLSTIIHENLTLGCSNFRLSTNVNSEYHGKS